ncbi:hypothetical protein EGW08_002877, partial [Elysia chlorotica]
MDNIVIRMLMVYSSIKYQHILASALILFAVINLSLSANSIKYEEKSKVNNKCVYYGTGWNKVVFFDDSLFPSFHGWLRFLRQSYLSIFPVDDNEPNHLKIVRNVLFSVVKPKPFLSGSTLVAISEDVLTKCLNLNPVIKESDVFLKFVSGQRSAGVPVALAHRYGGHQFGYWSGQLGDGRAALLGTFLNSDGNYWELNLKGSGLTPFSRQGDGRAVLRSSIREFLASEAMHFLGVPTSRALSLVVSEDAVIRDEFYNGNPKAERGAMVVRVAPSWFRIGSVEILAFDQELRLLQSLLDYVVRHHFVHIDVEKKDKYLMLFEEIVNGTAHLIAAWQSFGFTHGVCNTDNFSLLSLTIDYGPFGFLDEYNLDFVPNTSDDEGRYSYRKQPSVGYYNLDKLKVALDPILTKDQQETAEIILNGYYEILNRTLLQRFAKKLGLPSSPSTTDADLVTMFLDLMRLTHSDFTMSFRQLGEAKLDDLIKGDIHPTHWALMQLSSSRKFKIFLGKYLARMRYLGLSDSDRMRNMCKVNPVYVLRTWMAHSAI